MNKLKTIILSSSLFILINNTYALSLKESVSEVLRTNPIIIERLKNYRMTQQDLHVAESEYYPKIDLRAIAGYTSAGDTKDYATDDEYEHTVLDESYKHYETSLTLTQNIFNGFSTTHKVKYEEARILAAAYNYLEKANDTAFRMVDAYINLLRAYELAEISVKNMQLTKDIYNKVQYLYNAGLTTESELKKIESALLLASSNLTVKQNNAKDAEYSFKKVLGRMPEKSEIKVPDLNIKIPANIQKAALYAVEHNPSLLVAQYDVKGAEELYKQSKKGNYPSIDFEVSKFYNDVEERNSFDSPDDRFRARIVLNYNLYNGGLNKALTQKYVSKINQEVAIKAELKRQVIEGLELSWNAYEMIEEQLSTLKKFSKFAQETLVLYEHEYDLGRRSLLDLLSSQNDVINAETQIIGAKYDYLFSKYRILDAMGILVKSIVDEANSKELISKVNLYQETEDKSKEILDTLPIESDFDKDLVNDNFDLCDNSVSKSKVMKDGCKKLNEDSDNDNIPNILDLCPKTPKGVEVALDGCALDIDEDGISNYIDQCPNTPVDVDVDSKGCPIDSDLDGVADYKDKCLNTKIGEKVDKFGCTKNSKYTKTFKNVNSLTILFPMNSSYIPVSYNSDIAALAKKINNDKKYNLLVTGFSSHVGDFDYNQWLSKRRSKSVIKRLEELGVETNRITMDFKGETKATNNNTQSQKVEIQILKN
jgi:adhesin transport system outer membrane protein